MTPADLEARLALYREACASMYQFAGMFIPYGVPVEILDNLSALAQGKEPPHPWKAHEAALIDRIEQRGAAKELRAQIEWLISASDDACFSRETRLAIRGVALRFLARAAELEGR